MSSDQTTRLRRLTTERGVFKITGPRKPVRNMSGKASQTLAAWSDQRALGYPPARIICQYLVRRCGAQKSVATPVVRTGAAPGRITDHDDVHETDVVVDYCAVGEGGERPRLDTPRYSDAKNKILLTPSLIFDQCREHQLRAGEILAIGDTWAIVTPETGVERQDPRLRVARPPLRPRAQDHRQHLELDL